LATIAGTFRGIPSAARKLAGSVGTGAAVGGRRSLAAIGMTACVWLNVDA
jgi:hypothetical protein